MQQIGKQPAFELGQIVATPGARAALKKAGQQQGEFLMRHVNREWGDLDEEDRKENDYSLEHGFRLLSAYKTNAGDRLWILTEADRSLRRIKSKCPSWRGEAPDRPRCQGRVVFAFIGAKRRPLIRRSGRSGAGFGKEGQNRVGTMYECKVSSRR